METDYYRLTYEQMTDGELEQVLADRADLVPEAVAALDAEVRRRGMEPAEGPVWVRSAGSTERVASLADYPAYVRVARRRVIVSRFAAAAGMVPLVIALLVSRAIDADFTVGVVLSLAWLVAVVAYAATANLRLMRWACPQCGDRFGPGASCRSCGFPRNA